jgi:hypothetical protein
MEVRTLWNGIEGDWGAGGNVRQKNVKICHEDTFQNVENRMVGDD